MLRNSGGSLIDLLLSDVKRIILVILHSSSPSYLTATNQHKIAPLDSGSADEIGTMDNRLPVIESLDVGVLSDNTVSTVPVSDGTGENNTMNGLFLCGI